MAWTNKQIALAITLVVFGSTNVLSAKWTDKLTAKNSAGKDAPFNHPFLQTCAMFCGEITCLIVFKIQMCRDKCKKEPKTIGNSNMKWNPIIFLPPALCDITGTSINFIGLNLTYASSQQMLRGAMLVSTGFLSVAFLQRKFESYEWLGIFAIVVGLVGAGITDAIYPSETKSFNTNSIITGDLLIIIAQLIFAVQLVIEEKFTRKYDVPALQGVGWEGLFGFSILSFLLIPLYFIKVGNSIFDNPGGRMEDAYDGFVQMYNNPLIVVAVTGQIVSVAFFNFSGLSLTKEISATNRLVLESSTTLTVWIFSLSIGWQAYHYLQLVVFLTLLCGMCIYNNFLLRPFYVQLRKKCGEKYEFEPLLRSSSKEITSTPIRTTLTIMNGCLSPQKFVV